MLVGCPATMTDKLLIIGITAPAGGLNASKQLAALLPCNDDIAYIIVQYCNTDHANIVADVLSGCSAMVICDVAEGMTVGGGQIYLTPADQDVSVVGGRFHLAPRPDDGRTDGPFDTLLTSLAATIGQRALAVVLAGPGSDGTAGAQAIKAAGGMVIAQDPEGAASDSRARSVIRAGAVDAVLPLDAMAEEILLRLAVVEASGDGHMASGIEQDWIARIIAVLHAKTPAKFFGYKRGPIQRRIERRMLLAGLTSADGDCYVDLLEGSAEERTALASDLLINVTGFFRDPEIFEALKPLVIADLVRDRDPHEPLRIWVPGCSSGQEAYTIAMLFIEALEAAGSTTPLQIFGSDADGAAIAQARAGYYPAEIVQQVSAERLARFFVEDGAGYSVSRALRETLVFAVQDVLADPPFSHIDLISCRNLLIYLDREAQDRVIALFDFALRDHGILLLGKSETLGFAGGQFTTVSKQNRVYRRIERAGYPRSGALGERRDIPRIVHPPGLPHASPQRMFADLCKQVVLDDYAPAAVLVNRRNECLYSTGPTHRYLRAVPGLPTSDLLALAPPATRIKLSAAIQQATESGGEARLGGGRDDQGRAFSITARTIRDNDDDLVLVCFIDDPVPPKRRGSNGSATPDDIAGLEVELESMRADLQRAIETVESLGAEKRTIAEEAARATEDYKSANEELLALKEELISLNEELVPLNRQLREVVDTQQAVTGDLQNVLRNIDVAALFLDADLRIRFFTPATRALFHLLPGDIGRPLEDLHALTPDPGLLEDALRVLAGDPSVEHKVESPNKTRFARRITPYLDSRGVIAGVVITFTDITEREHASEALEAAVQQAEKASASKSHFLAAASHDLRQPLQALNILHELIARAATGTPSQDLAAKLKLTLGAMTNILDALLDINRIEAGVITPDVSAFPVTGLLTRIAEEFDVVVRAKGLALKVVPSRHAIASDPALLEQIIRNLVANAIKYTPAGRILIGCRVRADRLRIEVWDTGVGIGARDLQSIFDEYHRVRQPEPDGPTGLGLGLSIVQRLADILGHDIQVRSQPGKGSMFGITVALADAPEVQAIATIGAVGPYSPLDSYAVGASSVLVIEDDDDLRGLLELLLTDDGYTVVGARDANHARQLLLGGALVPDMILADYSLADGVTGLAAIDSARRVLARDVPAVVLTGEVTAVALRHVAAHRCEVLNKPVDVALLRSTMANLLAGGPSTRPGTVTPKSPRHNATVYIVDDDPILLLQLREALMFEGFGVEIYPDAETFLYRAPDTSNAVLLVDLGLPHMDGISLLQQLRAHGDMLPTIVITGRSDVDLVVQAMKAGAADFIGKPIDHAHLIAIIEQVLEIGRNTESSDESRQAAQRRLARLTARQLQIMDMVLAGHPNKNIAADLGLSRRTVENHRASVMRKTEARSVPELARLALRAKEAGAILAPPPPPPSPQKDLPL